MSNPGMADAFETTHLIGDIQFVNKYRESWWWMAAALCVLAPPAGAVLGGMMLVACLTTDGDETVVTPE